VPTPDRADAIPEVPAQAIAPFVASERAIGIGVSGLGAGRGDRMVLMVTLGTGIGGGAGPVGAVIAAEEAT
jgi:predicted NBD/HSP70 family sugar kinase